MEERRTMGRGERDIETGVDKYEGKIKLGLVFTQTTMIITDRVTYESRRVLDSTKSITDMNTQTHTYTRSS